VRDADCYDFVSDCRVRLATDLLSHTWDPVVLSALRRGPLRRRELLSAVGGMSDKSLTEALSRLARNGLVSRADRSTARLVVYALTDLGQSFVEGPMASLGRWAVEHADEVEAAQTRDRASP
jgi:DNA-binding HxlR family transcriptional regulator